MKIIHIILLFFVFFSSLYAKKEDSFEYKGVRINANGHIYNVKREVPHQCAKIKINNNLLWQDNSIKKDIPKKCKGTFIKTVGKISPIQINDEIETYGELEVLAFIKEMKKNKKMLLIDSRSEQYFFYQTIPSAINIPFKYFKHREKYDYDFECEEEITRIGGIVEKNKTINFDKAKTLLIFCNGAWCSQSIWLIQSLLALDYPPEKIKWYRGGMQSWISLGMTTTKDESLF